MRNVAVLAGLLGALIPSACDATRPDGKQTDAIPSARQAALDLGRDLSVGATGDDVAALHDYLAAYGYLPNAALATTHPAWRPVGAASAPERGTYDQHTRTAVLALQRRAGLPESGVVDLATRQLLALRRCDVPEGTSALDRGSRFPLHGSTWSKTTLTWSIVKPPTDLDAAELTREVSEAFATFHAETNLAFVAVASGADIEIRFDRIDGPGASVARAASPASGGDVTIDSEEPWSTAEATAPDRLDVRTVLLHQLGHALGLVHARSNETVMYPYARAGGQRRALAADDRIAISALYDSWSERLTGQALDVAVGANGDAWAVVSTSAGMGSVVARRTATDWQQVPGDFPAARIAVAPDATAWICDKNGGIWSRADVGGQWVQRPGCCIDLGAGADGSIWGVGCPGIAGGYRIYKWNGTDWNEATGEQGGARISVGPTGIPWIVDNRGMIYRRTSADWSSGGWNAVSGVANDIAIGPEGAVWRVGAVHTLGGYKLYLWNDSPAGTSSEAAGSWITVIGGATNITVGPTGPWAVNEWGGIWQQTALKSPYQ